MGILIYVMPFNTLILTWRLNSVTLNLATKSATGKHMFLFVNTTFNDNINKVKRYFNTGHLNKIDRKYVKDTIVARLENKKAYPNVLLGHITVCNEPI
jgi:hypothetical protein